MSASFKRFERAHPDSRSTIRDRFPFKETLSLLPKRSASWKSLRASVSISFVLHALLLLMLSMIFFNLPGTVVLDSILSLVISTDESTGDDRHDNSRSQTPVQSAGAANLPVSRLTRRDHRQEPDLEFRWHE